MSLSFSLKPFDLNDVDSLVDFFAKEFPPNDKLLRADYLQWLYLANPHGTAKIVTAAEEGRWIGFLAMTPVALIREGEPRTGYFVVNVLVDPAYRGQNIFGRMIETAIEQIKVEGALLLGHPNAAAYGSWRRAGMDFHSALRARLISPIPLCSGELRAKQTEESPGLKEFLESCNEEASRARRLAVNLSEEYLAWRFFRHPTNRYRSCVVCRGNAVVGLVIIKKLRLGLNLLIDCFALKDYRDAALSFAPWFTFALATPSLARATPRLWPTTIKKEFPFFCTDYRRPVAAPEVEALGLSASDL